MSIINKIRRLNLILKNYEENPNTPKCKSGGYQGVDYFGNGKKSYSKNEIDKIKKELTFLKK